LFSTEDSTVEDELETAVVSSVELAFSALVTAAEFVELVGAKLVAVFAEELTLAVFELALSAEALADTDVVATTLFAADERETTVKPVVLVVL
jgi:hypothetical protein